MSRRELHADVVVVGGGIMGAAAAYHLQLQGARTVLLERAIIGDNASGRNGGGVRQQNRSPQELELAMYSIGLWHDLSNELGHDVEYRPDGVFSAAFDAQELRALEQSARRQREAGLAVETLDRAGAQRRFPGISEAIVGGNICESDGHANPLATMRAYEIGLRRVGVDVQEGQPLLDVEHAAGRMLAVQTPGLRVVASRLLLCAGAHTAHLTRALGLRLPITPKKPEMMVTERMPPFIRGMIGAPGGYLRQAVAGNVHFGINSKPLRHLDYRSSARSLVRLAEGLLTVYPHLRDVRMLRTWAGITSWTPDALPIIDRVPGTEGIFFATGFSGHGFALGPGVGRALAATVLGRSADVSLRPFSLSRFS